MSECRAPYTPDEAYKPPRLPNSAIVMPNGPSNTQLTEDSYAAPTAAVINTHSEPFSIQLSANACEFVPNNLQPALVSSVQRRLDPHLRVQQFHHHHQQQHQVFYTQAQQQPQHQNRQIDYYNGFQQQQLQPQYQYNNNAGVRQLTNSVQERLNIGPSSSKSHQQSHYQYNNNASVQQLTNSVQEHLNVGPSGSKQQQHSGNYIGQQQQPHQLHNKVFQKHVHLNNYLPQQQQQHRNRPHQVHIQDKFYNNGQGDISTAGAERIASVSKVSNTDSSATMHPDMEIIALEYLDTVIHCLNQNPGQFDTIAPRFLTIFEGMENNEYVLPISMEDIFEKSIENPNFRYMGAKLYSLLHMMNPKKDSLFHILLKCKLDYHKEEVVSFMQTGQQHKVRETALFLAELYMQLRGDDSRIHLIAENVVYSLKQLISKVTDENVRCICLTLKLAGYDLTTDCPEDMEEIISKLNAINLNSPGKYSLAESVLKLQKDNWGRKVNSLGETDVAEQEEPLRLSDEPVFYGPDGNELTTEETDFLHADTNNDDEEDDDEVEDDEFAHVDCVLYEDMDEETGRSYKDFCKQVKLCASFADSASVPSSSSDKET